MSSYFFVLGNTPQLSLAELEAFLPNLEFKTVLSSIVLAETAAPLDAQNLINRLGGTVKILELKHQVALSGSNDVGELLFNELSSHEGRIEFAIAEHGRDHLPKVNTQNLKNQLTEAGHSTRFIEASRQGLSASVLLHRSRIIELNVIQNADALYLAQTVAVQDIDEWSNRDRGKPYADRKKGMLPPKVARIMVNIALAGRDINPEQPVTLYDPFCGTGTVLMEAALSGCRVIGSDTDADATTGTQDNLAWLSHQYTQTVDDQVVTGDVTQIHRSQLNNGQLIDCIVTEPFLGKPKPQPAALPNIFKGLEKLYLGAFKNWTSILKNGGQIVIVFPYVTHERHTYSMETLIDKLAGLGYTMMSKPILYSRPQAIVQRQICIFTLEK